MIHLFVSVCLHELLKQHLGQFTMIYKTKTNKTPGASCIKLYVDFILKVYVDTSARFYVRTKVFRFIKPGVHRNLRKNHFINSSQGKIVRMCISTPTPPVNHHIWSLQLSDLCPMSCVSLPFVPIYGPSCFMFIITSVSPSRVS